MTRRGLGKPILFFTLAVLADIGILVARDFSIRYLCAFALLLILPGFGLMRWVLGPDDGLGRAERVVLSLGGSFAMTLVVTLIVHYLPGKPTLPIALGFYTLSVLGPWLLSWGRRSAPVPTRTPLPVIHIIALSVIVLVAGFFFFTHLGTAEFQGDESMVMLDAGGALQGDDSVLFFHRKGPAEILLPTAFWLLSGSVTELTARLPFAVAGLLAVLALYLLGRRAFNEFTGFVAAALLALNGFFIGFSRIVQYQSLVMMSTGLAILCFYIFYRDNRPRYQILGGLFLAIGLLAHYDGFFALPVIVYLYWRKWGVDIKSYLHHWRTLLAAALVVVGLLSLFYIPFLQPRYFSQTSGYLSFRAGGQMLYNNLVLWFTFSTTYNSTYYILLLLVLLLVTVVRQMRSLRHQPYPALGLLFLAMLSVLAFPDLWRAGRYNAAFLPFLATALVVYLASRRSADLTAAWVWFAVPFLFYNFFLIKQPGTHFWTLCAGLALLSAIALDDIRAWALKRGASYRTLSLAGGIAALALFLLFAGYLYAVFIRVYPEYRTAYPSTKSPLYWTVYNELPPRDYFGFPHRAGWKAISGLYAQGTLQGEYDSNEGGEITSWYVPEAPRYFCKPSPRYYFVAESVVDAQNLPKKELASEFAETGLVTVGGHPGIHIYERGAAPGQVRQYASEDYEQEFDRSRKPWDRLTAMGQFMSTPYAANFGNLAELLGYDLDTSRACSGGNVVLTLYWRRQGPEIRESYKVFVHVGADRLWAQADDVPGCSAWPTTGWRANEVIADRHVIALESDVPAGSYPLVIGLYQPERGSRLEIIDGAGQAQGDRLALGTITVRDSRQGQ